MYMYNVLFIHHMTFRLSSLYFRLFFDASDGIFLNYCWTSEDLQVSKENAVKADRPYDVYVGIDVYGRGCLGGGGFNTAEVICTYL